MRVENIQFKNLQQMKALLQGGSDAAQPSVRSVETSIYDKKGLTLPFAAGVKGLNKIENECIVEFRGKFGSRRLANGRKTRERKFTEPEIDGFMNELRANPREKNMISVVKELFDTHKTCYEEFGAPLKSAVPDAEFVTNYLKAAKNCDEFERLGLIGFTQHELCVGATKPLESLANATPEHQRKFIRIMNDISYDVAGSEHSEILYDDLRHVIYATEDLPTLDEAGKLQYVGDVQADFKRLKADNTFETEAQKESALRISRNIVDTMIDVLKI